MAHTVYSNDAHGIGNFVYNSIVANSNSPIALRAGQLASIQVDEADVPKAAIALTIRSCTFDGKRRSSFSAFLSRRTSYMSL